MARTRIEFAQNFIKSKGLVKTLLQSSSLTNLDTVYEIGPGEGIITYELSRVAKKVIAIELDNSLVEHLKLKFSEVKNIEIHHADFMRYQISSQNYKIFANIPFNITSDIVKKLVTAKFPPEEAYLIMQKEAAMKFSGDPIATEFSVLLKPWFEFKTIREISRQSFEPIPAVDVVFFVIKRRTPALISSSERAMYQSFVRHGFESWKKDLKTAFKKVYTYNQWKRLSHDLKFSLHATPSQLTFEQWLGLYKFFAERLPPEKGILV